MTNRGFLSLILAFSVCALVGIYVLMGFYYDDSFSYGTWINHVYCTGKSVDDVNNELKKTSLYSGLIITEENGQRFFVDGSLVGYTVDYKNELEGILESQNPLAWGLNIFTSRDRMIGGDASLDKEKLREVLSQWTIFEEDYHDNYEIRRDDEGYFLVDNAVNRPIFDVFLQKAEEAITNKEYTLDLSNSPECYQKAVITEEDEEVKAIFEKVDSYQKKDIGFSIFDTRFEVPQKDISDAIVTLDELETKQDEKISDEKIGEGYFVAGSRIIPFPEDYKVQGNFITDNNDNLLLSCSDFYSSVSLLLDQIDTRNGIKEYQKNGDGEIVVSGRKDGVLFDKREEYNKLLDSLRDNEKATVDIEVPTKSFVIDARELGDEYILVDMGKQHLSYYKNGQLTIQYDVVTGNTGLGRGTPVGLYHIYNKRYHTILRGADYASYVNYWLGVNKGIGIHDATWRRDFGGEIYKRSGSHGCINSPLEKMEELYNTVEVGVPVLLFY